MSSPIQHKPLWELPVSSWMLASRSRMKVALWSCSPKPKQPPNLDTWAECKCFVTAARFHFSLQISSEMQRGIKCWPSAFRSRCHFCFGDTFRSRTTPRTCLLSFLFPTLPPPCLFVFLKGDLPSQGATTAPATGFSPKCNRWPGWWLFFTIKNNIFLIPPCESSKPSSTYSYSARTTSEAPSRWTADHFISIELTEGEYLSQTGWE